MFDWWCTRWDIWWGWVGVVWVGCRRDSDEHHFWGDHSTITPERGSYYWERVPWPHWWCNRIANHPSHWWWGVGVEAVGTPTPTTTTHWSSHSGRGRIAVISFGPCWDRGSSTHDCTISRSSASTTCTTSIYIFREGEYNYCASCCCALERAYTISLPLARKASIQSKLGLASSDAFSISNELMRDWKMKHPPSTWAMSEPSSKVLQCCYNNCRWLNSVWCVIKIDILLSYALEEKFCKLANEVVMCPLSL